MYLCQICQHCSEPGEARKVHTLYRHVPRNARIREVDNQGTLVVRPEGTTRTEILSEIPVCHECKAMLDSGIPLSLLLRQRGEIKRMGTITRPPEATEATEPTYNPVSLQPGQGPKNRPGTRPARSPHLYK